MERYKEKIKQLIDECNEIEILEYLSTFIEYYIKQNN